LIRVRVRVIVNINFRVMVKPMERVGWGKKIIFYMKTWGKL